MANDHFRFKQFTIYHDKCAMKVGTDGVLLGAWCETSNVLNALDIGTGSGLIAIMVAQRNRNCHIDAVEIDTLSANQAKENIESCPWAGRIKLHNHSFQQFSLKCETRYDLIVSNPPWFAGSLASPVPERTAARHADYSLSMQDLLAGAKKLLAPDGRLSIIMAVNEANTFIKMAMAENLYCTRQTSVLPNPEKPPKRYLMEFTQTPGNLIKSEIIIELERRHRYSGEFKKLTGNFYLYFRY